MLLFADDVILISSSIIGLQNQIDILSSYSDKWQLNVNLDKTNIVVFRRGGPLSTREKWFYKNKQINVVNEYKYLGILVTHTLNLTKSVHNLAMRAKKALLQLQSIIPKLGVVPINVYFKMFDSQIQPILLYGSEVWGFKEYYALEKVHLLACKKFLNVSISTPSAMVYGECGRYPLYITSYCRCLKYWFKIITMPEHRLPKKAT